MTYRVLAAIFTEYPTPDLGLRPDGIPDDVAAQVEESLGFIDETFAPIAGGDVCERHRQAIEAYEQTGGAPTPG